MNWWLAPKNFPRAAASAPVPFHARAPKLLCIMAREQGASRATNLRDSSPQNESNSGAEIQIKSHTSTLSRLMRHTGRERHPERERERKFNSSLSARADNRALKRKYEFASGGISNLNTRRGLVCARAGIRQFCMRRRRQGKIKALVLIQQREDRMHVYVYRSDARVPNCPTQVEM
jgi:hypothetical protein